MLLYYITDRKQLGGDESQCRRCLLLRIERAAQAGVDFIQLREKDLSARERESLARDAVQRIAGYPRTKLLINSRSDVCIAVEAHGVHLRADDISAGDARAILCRAKAFSAMAPLLAVSCHTSEEVAIAESQGADFAVFAPVFGKREAEASAAAGLDALRQACQREVAAAARMPVLALGGVTLENAADCLAAGAAGIAGIRLFQQGNVEMTVRTLRELNVAQAPSASHQRHPYQS